MRRWRASIWLIMSWCFGVARTTSSGRKIETCGGTTWYPMPLQSVHVSRWRQKRPSFCCTPQDLRESRRGFCTPPRDTWSGPPHCEKHVQPSCRRQPDVLVHRRLRLDHGAFVHRVRHHAEPSSHLDVRRRTKRSGGGPILGHLRSPFGNAFYTAPRRFERL